MSTPRPKNAVESTGQAISKGPAMPKGIVARWIVLVIVLLSIPAFGFVWIVQNQSDAVSSVPGEGAPEWQD